MIPEDRIRGGKMSSQREVGVTNSEIDAKLAGHAQEFPNPFKRYDYIKVK